MDRDGNIILPRKKKMQALLDSLWENRFQLCGGPGPQRSANPTMRKILEQYLGYPLVYSEPVTLQKLVIQNLTALTRPQLLQVQRLIPFLYTSSYSIKKWYVPVSREAGALPDVVGIRNYMRIEKQLGDEHNLKVQERLNHKNAHQLRVNWEHYAATVLEWARSERLVDNVCALLAAIGCRRVELIDPQIQFDFSDNVVYQEGVAKSKHDVSIEKPVIIIPNAEELLELVRAHFGEMEEKSRVEMGHNPIFAKANALIKQAIPGAKGCHTLRAIYCAATFDPRAQISFTAHIQRVLAHSSLDTALHYQGICLV